ncbi:hypothetical protein Tco_0891149 [Tanacetum coccineum]|uniref:Uncharacterized protein n=1 Tax=Tanacetum coccineum TaxID=301880 RepID=A0ABQ5C525_9ASTR
MKMKKKNIKNSTLKDTEPEEERKGNAEMTDAGYDDSTQQTTYEQVKDVDNEVVSMMNVKVHHEEPSTQTPPLLTIHVMVIPETSTAAAPTIPPTIPSITPLPQ